MKVMVKVSIADVLGIENTDEEMARTTQQFVVVLKQDGGNRAFPIWVGPAEGEAIVMGLKDIQLPRPMTHNFIANLLGAAGVEIEEVRVEVVERDTFIGVAKIRVGDVVSEVDARPSDVFALAVRTGAPIYAAEDVIDRAGVEIPLETSPALKCEAEITNMGKLAEDMINSMQKASEQRSEAQVTHSTEELSDRMKNMARNIIGQVFGGSA